MTKAQLGVLVLLFFCLVAGQGIPARSQVVQQEEAREATPISWDTPAAITGSSPALVSVGPGFSDVGTHQVIRTGQGRVYIFAPELYAAVVHAYRAVNIGIPSEFQEADSGNRPSGIGDISAVDAAIDGNGLVHLLWLDEAGPVIYQTFDTTTDRWNQPFTIAQGGVWPNPGNGTRQGSEGVALAVDSSGVPHAVFTRVENGLRRLWYRNLSGGEWSPDVRVDDIPNHNNGHPVLALDRVDRLTVAWLVEQTGVNTGDIRLRSRAADGTWNETSIVVDSGPNVYSDDRFAIDQGPSLVISHDGAKHLAYIAAWERSYSCPSDDFQYGSIRYSFSTASGWESMRPEPARFTHNPSLATNSRGDLYLFGHDDPCLHPDAAGMYLLRRTPGASWGERKLVAEGPFDSSVSVKRAGAFLKEPDLVEALFWTQTQPNQLYYTAIP